jgi:diguanylate cyclase (GGDEF)-like protein
VSQWTAGFVIAEMLVYGYRAIITNLSYSQPWMTNTAQQDPRWNYSLMAMMFLSTCVLMCDLWFFVVELQRELITRARTDSLTGALNRRALYEEAEREISRTVRAGHDFSVLLIDIDDFKLMNDTRGHAAGDFALQRLVNTVRSMLRTEDWLARTGGEEFAILLPETDVEQALVVAERIRSSIEHMNLVFENVRLSISASIGVAQMSTSVPTVDDVLHRADIAMYSAKRGGKNRTVVYRDGMTSNPDLDPTSLSDLINSTAH